MYCNPCGTHHDEPTGRFCKAAIDAAKQQEKVLRNKKILLWVFILILSYGFKLAFDTNSAGLIVFGVLGGIFALVELAQSW